MGKGKFNPKNGNGKPTMNGVIATARDESGVVNVGLVSAGKTYQVIGKIEEEYSGQIGLREIKGQARCTSVGGGRATFHGVLDETGGQIWRAEVSLDSMYKGREGICLGSNIRPKVVGPQDHGYKDFVKFV